MPHYQYGQHRIDYSIRRSSRRTLSITVDPQEGVVARAPALLSDARIEAFIASKAGWILRHLLSQQARREESPIRDLSDGAMLLYQGEPMRLRLEPGSSARGPRVDLREGVIAVRGAQNEAAVREALTRWYRREAMSVLRPRVRHFCELLGLPMPLLYVRAQARRWGSCSSAGEIRLNWRLILAPSHLADYVCAHEVCHLRVMNHSPRFWRLLESILPDSALLRSELRENAPRYDF